MVTGDGGEAEVAVDLAEETVATAEVVEGVIGGDTGEAVVVGERENLMRRERIGRVAGDCNTYYQLEIFKFSNFISNFYLFSSTGRGGGFRGGRDRENGRGGPKGGHNGYRE